MKIMPIRSQKDHEAALQRASQLMTKADQKSLDELDLLQALIELWERTRYEIPAPTPLEAIRFRMEQNGLKPRDLEPYLGSRSRVSEILSGDRPLSIDMIRALHRHLGIPAVSLIGSDKDDSSKSQRPSKAALDKLRTFGVLKPQEEFSAFLTRAFHGCAPAAVLRKTRTKRTNAKTDFAAIQAWCGAVLVKAESRKVKRTKLPCEPKFGRELAQLSVQPHGPILAREALAHKGIIFLSLDHLPGTFLDGAALRRSDGTPIIALTIRHDRIDNFWFTLLHEYAHVCHHLKDDTTVILDDLDVKSSEEIEAEADEFAQSSLIPKTLWRRIASPDLTPQDVEDIAAEASVHPAVVAGRWQREHNDYRRFSKMLGRSEVRCQFAARDSDNGSS